MKVELFELLQDVMYLQYNKSMMDAFYIEFHALKPLKDICIETGNIGQAAEFRRQYLYTKKMLKQKQRKPIIKSPFGHSYIQRNTVGLASYHFDEDTPYISYENAPDCWRLDNNQKLPIRKKFQGWSYDSRFRIFRGDIAWTEATLRGDALWKYDFVFSRDFNRIESGDVTCYNAEGEITAVTQFRCESCQAGLVYILNRNS